LAESAGLIGAVLAEQHDDWAEGRRYLGLDVRALIPTDQTTTEKEDLTPLEPARMSQQPLMRKRLGSIG
jgi:hypothetical protein